MRHLAALVVGISVAGQTASALAQEVQAPPPSSAQNNMTTRSRNSGFENEYNTKVVLGSALTPEKKAEAVHSVVDCLIRRDPAEVGSMVGGPMTADENYEALTKALSRKYSRCVDRGAAGISMATVNGVLAEELVRRSPQTYDPRAKNVDVTKAQQFYGTASPTMASIGRCLVVYSPGLAKDVLLSTAGSPNEKAAIDAVFAKTPECGVRTAPADIPLDEQRSAIASGLYLWSHRG